LRSQDGDSQTEDGKLFNIIEDGYRGGSKVELELILVLMRQSNNVNASRT